MKILVYLLTTLFLFSACKKNEENEEMSDAVLQTEIIKENLSHVWEILYGPDKHLWFTERSGKISRLDLETHEVKPLLQIADVQAKGEGGLLGMVIHPDFSAQPYVYVVYNYSSGEYKEKVVRYTYSNETLSSPQIIMDNIPAANIHNGSRLLITPDNKLLVTIGDASNANRAQDKGSLSGKILRLNLDGSVPSDNPFENSPVWTYGHRNAQGLVQVGQKVFSSEHGPNSDDEVNIIEKGKNYGWPNVKGFCDESGEQEFCSQNDIREPLKAYTPTIATCGLAYYNHDEIPQWKNSLLMVTLKDQTLRQLKLSSDQTSILSESEFYRSEFGRLRSICISPDGQVFIGTSNGSNDRIIAIRAAADAR